MVTGIEKFRDHFAGHESQYAIIGGAACDLLFGEAGLPFRATKDVDMVLCVEVVDATLGERFKVFLDAGGYQARERDGKKEFYRFHKPTDPNFPFMIELFARKPGTLNLPDDAQVTPIPVDKDVVSLSAILLDDTYYAAIQSAKRVVDGVTTVDETLLIPFKARAFLDLSDRSANGEKVDGKNIKKHRNDVFRLAQLLRTGEVIELAESIKADLRQFLERAGKDDTLDPKSFDVPFSRDEGIKLLRTAYGIA
jgi:hypothetical protein